jgi:hypothetical protein
VFVGIFQQVPMLFTYSYESVALADEMTEASMRGVVGILDQKINFSIPLHNIII